MGLPRRSGFSRASRRGPGVVTRGAGPHQGPEELHGPDVLGAVTGCPVIALSLGTPAVTVASVRAVTCGSLTLREWVRLSGSRLSWCHVLNKNPPVFPYRSRHGTCLPSCGPRESQAPLLPAGEPEAGGVHAGRRLRPTHQRSRVPTPGRACARLARSRGPGRACARPARQRPRQASSPLQLTHGGLRFASLAS